MKRFVRPTLPAEQSFTAPVEPVPTTAAAGRGPGLRSLAKLVFALFVIGGAILGMSSLASAASKSCSGGSAGEQAACRAEKQVGDRYAWGAEGPNAFDCSGLAYYAYKGSGLKVTRTTAEGQSHLGKAVSAKDLKKGDLIFFNYDGGGDVDHVGIYVGNGKMVDAPGQGRSVREIKLTDYYKDHIETVRRVAPTTKKKTTGTATAKKTVKQPAKPAKPASEEITSLTPAYTVITNLG